MRTWWISFGLGTVLALALVALATVYGRSVTLWKVRGIDEDLISALVTTAARAGDRASLADGLDTAFAKLGASKGSPPKIGLALIDEQGVVATNSVALRGLDLSSARRLAVPGSEYHISAVGEKASMNLLIHRPELAYDMESWHALVTVPIRQWGADVTWDVIWRKAAWPCAITLAMFVALAAGATAWNRISVKGLRERNTRLEGELAGRDAALTAAVQRAEVLAANQRSLEQGLTEAETRLRHAESDAGRVADLGAAVEEQRTEKQRLAAEVERLKSDLAKANQDVNIALDTASQEAQLRSAKEEELESVQRKLDRRNAQSKDRGNTRSHRDERYRLVLGGVVRLVAPSVRLVSDSVETLALDDAPVVPILGKLKQLHDAPGSVRGERVASAEPWCELRQGDKRIYYKLVSHAACDVLVSTKARQPQDMAQLKRI